MENNTETQKTDENNIPETGSGPITQSHLDVVVEGPDQEVLGTQAEETFSSSEDRTELPKGEERLQGEKTNEQTTLPSSLGEETPEKLSEEKIEITRDPVDENQNKDVDTEHIAIVEDSKATEGNSYLPNDDAVEAAKSLPLSGDEHPEIRAQPQPSQADVTTDQEQNTEAGKETVAIVSGNHVSDNDSKDRVEEETAEKSSSKDTTAATGEENCAPQEDVATPGESKPPGDLPPINTVDAGAENNEMLPTEATAKDIEEGGKLETSKADANLASTGDSRESEKADLLLEKSELTAESSKSNTGGNAEIAENTALDSPKTAERGADLTESTENSNGDSNVAPALPADQEALNVQSQESERSKGAEPNGEIVQRVEDETESTNQGKEPSLAGEQGERGKGTPDGDTPGGPKTAVSDSATLQKTGEEKEVVKSPVSPALKEELTAIASPVPGSTNPTELGQDGDGEPRKESSKTVESGGAQQEGLGDSDRGKEESTDQLSVTQKETVQDGGQPQEPKAADNSQQKEPGSGEEKTSDGSKEHTSDQDVAADTRGQLSDTPKEPGSIGEETSDQGKAENRNQLQKESGGQIPEESLPMAVENDSAQQEEAGSKKDGDVVPQARSEIDSESLAATEHTETGEDSEKASVTFSLATEDDKTKSGLQSEYSESVCTTPLVTTPFEARFDFDTESYRDRIAGKEETEKGVTGGEGGEETAVPGLKDVDIQEVGTRTEEELSVVMSQAGGKAKSVTFADESIADENEVGEGEEEVEEGEEEEEENEDAWKEFDEAFNEEIESVEEQPSETREDETRDSGSAGVFGTEVSEGTIEEAMTRSNKSMISNDAMALDLFGKASTDIPEKSKDIIDKKAKEHFEKGLRYQREGDHVKAILCFDKAANLLREGHVEYYICRAESYLQLCDFQSALLNYKKVCMLEPSCHQHYSRLAFLYFFQAQSLFDQNMYPEALESFSRAAEMKPENVGYHTRSVACLAALQRHGECLALVNKRLETEDDNADLYIMRARLHELFRNTTLCYYDLKDALSLDPEQMEALTLMKKLEEKAEDYKSQAILFNLNGRYKDAVRKMSIAIEMNPSVAQYHILRGTLHRRLADFNAAIDDYLLALDKTNHNEESPVYQDAQKQLIITYNDFAVECFTKGYFEEAIILLNKAIKGEKREKGLYVNRGDCFFKQNDLHFALADYHQALEIDSADWNIRSRIARIHSEFGQLDAEEHSYANAESRYNLAIQHYPAKGQYYMQRAKVRYTLENQSGARQDMLMALHLETSNEDIISLLPRLFPGKSVGEVLRSKVARTAKHSVQSLLASMSPNKLTSLSKVRSESSKTTRSDSKRASGISKSKNLPGQMPLQKSFVSGFTDLQSCMDENEFNRHLIDDKKQISSKLKTMFREPQRLWYNGPRLAPVQALPQPSPLEETEPKGSRAGGWKTYGLGVTLL